MQFIQDLGFVFLVFTTVRWQSLFPRKMRRCGENLQEHMKISLGRRSSKAYRMCDGDIRIGRLAENNLHWKKDVRRYFVQDESSCES